MRMSHHDPAPISSRWPFTCKGPAHRRYRRSRRRLCELCSLGVRHDTKLPSSAVRSIATQHAPQAPLIYGIGQFPLAPRDEVAQGFVNRLVELRLLILDAHGVGLLAAALV